MIRLFVTIGCFLFCLSQSIAQTKTLTPELLWSLGRVQLQDVSPDDSLALYSVTYHDITTNQSSTDLYTVRVDGGSRGIPNRLTDTPEKETFARYRPDGNKIGYLKNGQFWEMDVDGKNSRKVTDLEMEGFRYSPDGSKVLFVQEVDYSAEPNPLYQDLPLANAQVFDHLLYRHWKSWEDEKYRNIFVVSYKNGAFTDAPVNITPEAFDAPFSGIEGVNWSPDEKYIIYDCKKLSGTEATLSTNSDIFLYYVPSGSTINLTEGMKGYDREPRFSPSGRFVSWSSMAKPAYEADRNRVFLYDFRTKRKWDMTASIDRTTRKPRWATNEEKMYFIGGDQGTYQLFEVNFNKKGRLRKMTGGFFDYKDYIVRKGIIVASRMSMKAPTELFRVSIDAAKANQITFTNKELLKEVKLGRFKKRQVQTTDSLRMLSWVIYPPDFDDTKSYPTLLYCQGGPQSAVSQYWSYRWNFQLMAAQGYIVIAPNRRGLPTFGQQWNDDIAGDWGGQPMQDLLTAIDDFKQESYVDSARIGAVGASYGGYSVYWLAGNHQKRFKSFISHCGVYNLESWYGTTDELFFANQDLQGPYWNDPQSETYGSDSPHLFVKNWDTPILVIHSEKDFRVPIGEGMQAFQAAQLQDIPSRFLYFPEEGHHISNPQNGIFWQRVFFDWLDQTLK
jgi:dipeptidyl aminopeptidase/acylaminoacyl peptidase